MFQKNYKRKTKESSNKDRKNPTISFRCNPKFYSYLNSLSNIKTRSKFINQSIGRNINLIHNLESFLSEIFMNNFIFARYILRKVGKRMRLNTLHISKRLKNNKKS